MPYTTVRFSDRVIMKRIPSQLVMRPYAITQGGVEGTEYDKNVLYIHYDRGNGVVVAESAFGRSVRSRAARAPSLSLRIPIRCVDTGGAGRSATEAGGPQ